ncbi:MAG TPA: hypothetical protein VLK82_16235 [Candidatus Tectomicrobia bacterium]|nr:hypothetical protein [Candidatus Tectomicrobia bacterium]
MLRACPGKPGAGNPHAGFHLGGEAQGRPRPLSTNHTIDQEKLIDLIAEEISDGRVLQLVREMLRA